MAFKDLHKLKKIPEIQKENIDCDFLVVGKDFFAIEAYLKLKEIHKDKSVRLISETDINVSDLTPKGPSWVRGEKNIEYVKSLMNEKPFELYKNQSLFYKDMTFKSFGGRSKSEALKYDEEFFTGPRLQFDFSDLLENFQSIKNELTNINQNAYKVKIKSIIKDKDNDSYLVECLNGTEFKTKELYFGKSPFNYLNLYKDKNHLPDNFIEFCESTKSHMGLFLKYVFNKPISDLKETMLIPLSYTHEWGHFVGEFENNSSSQSIEFLHFIDENHATEEDVSKTIRLLKRSLEKIFENFSKNLSEEFILLEEEMGCLKIDDTKFQALLNENHESIKNLKFLGINSPFVIAQGDNVFFEDSQIKISPLVRALHTRLNA